MKFETRTLLRILSSLLVMTVGLLVGILPGWPAGLLSPAKGIMALVMILYGIYRLTIFFYHEGNPRRHTMRNDD